MAITVNYNCDYCGHDFGSNEEKPKTCVSCGVECCEEGLEQCSECHEYHCTDCECPCQEKEEGEDVEEE